MAILIVRNDDGVMEMIMDSTDDVENIRTDAKPGSTAYTADLTYMAIKSPSGVWTQVASGAAAEEEGT